MSVNGMFGTGSPSAGSGGDSPSTMSISPGQGHNQQLDQGRRKLKELVRPIFQESYFTAEYCLLGALQINLPQKLNGLYAIPSAQSPFLWFGVLFVHNGPWNGGVFRFVMKFPDCFPDASSQNNLPTIQFTGAYPKYHPLINPSRGNFDIKRYYKTYNRSSHHIWQLLKCMRKIFYKLEIIEKIIYPNKAAAELYLKSEDHFFKMCETDVQNSKTKVFEEDMYSSDSNYIRFSKDHAKFKSAESGSDITQSSGIGLSFMSSQDDMT